MQCTGCKKDKELTNKHYKLCHECNNIRLHGNPFGKQHKFIKKKEKSVISKESRLKHDVKQGIRAKKSKVIKSRMIERLRRDEVFYKECFDNTIYHVCEECGKPLNTEFRDSEEKVIARFRYSHIIPKSTAPHLRHIEKNINHLCLEHHTQWDFGDKKSMRIYKKNKLKFPQYLS